MESIFNFFIYDNGIAFLALIISAVNFYLNYKGKRINIQFTVLDKTIGNPHGDEFSIFNVIVENHSQLPITITDINLIYQNQIFKFHQYSEFSDVITIPVENGQDIQEVNYTTGLPLTIAALDAKYCRFKVKLSKIETMQRFTLNIHTTRGIISKVIIYQNN